MLTRPAFVISLFIVGVLLRAVGLFNDLWIDEVWTVEGLRTINSWSEILTKLHSDNNHLLTSFYLYALGEPSDPAVCRLLSYLTGIGTLTLLTFRGPQKQRPFLVFLFSISFLMVLYDSEARGYAGVVFSTLLALDAIRNPAKVALLQFWLSCIVGILAHSLFLCALITFLLYLLILATQRKLRLRDVILITSVPLCFAALVGYLFIQHLPEGTGSLGPYIITIVNTISLILGAPVLSSHAPDQTGMVLFAVFASIILCIVGLKQIKISHPDKWCLYVLGIIISPIIFLVIGQPRVLFPRYFIVPITFFYLLLADTLTQFWHNGSSKAPRVITVAILTGFGIGNGIYLTRFLQDGRGRYLESLQFISDHEATNLVEVASDAPPRRTANLIAYYQPTLEKPFRYVSEESALVSPPPWLLHHTRDLALRPKPFVQEFGVMYSLQKETGYGGVSGFRWFVYQRTPAIETSPTK